MSKLEQRLDALGRLGGCGNRTNPNPALILEVANALVEEVSDRTRDTSPDGPPGESWDAWMVRLAREEGCSVEEVREEFNFLIREGLARIAALNRAGRPRDGGAAPGS